MAQANVVVIGCVSSGEFGHDTNFATHRAGVAGLTTALLLSRTRKYRIVVAAKHMPGDSDIEYASPWAGANYMP